MRRKLNEGEEFNDELLDGVKICVSDIRDDDSEMDCNELRDIFIEAGAEVFGSHGLKDGKPATIMTVKGLSEEEVVEILQEFLDNSDKCDDAEAYEVNDDADDTLHDPDDDNYEFPEYDDVDDTLHDPDNDNYEFPSYEDVETDDLDPEEDALNDDFLNENEDILEDAQEELRDILSNLGENDNITFKPKLGLDEANIISIDSNGDMETEDGDIINAFDLSADDIFTLCDEVKIELDKEAAYPDYDEIDDEDEELPRFEKIHRGRHLDEKKRGNCCPGTKTINESVINAVLEDLNAKALKESKEVEKKNQKELEKKTLKALTKNKHSLHENVSYNGKSFAKMTLKELKSIYKTVKASVDALSERSLNESVVDTKMVETINKKKQLLEFLDEEITYRTTRMECLNKLNEDSAEISDEELANLFGPAQGEDEPSSDNKDSDEGEDSNDSGEDENNDEEVELSRIEITLKDAEAANDLKQACLDADIPEDAFELENVEEDSATEDEETSDENSEESEESSEENSEEENSEEGANESYEFAKYVKMLGEGEVANEQPVDDVTSEESSEDENGEENTENTEGEDDKENSEEEEEDKQPKFILTNTDYASKLAKVLEDVYGISKEEFEDMIGGEIVEEEPKDDEKNSDEEGSENSDESKNDSEEKKDDEEEELDPSDLFKNL